LVDGRRFRRRARRHFDDPRIGRGRPNRDSEFSAGGHGLDGVQAEVPHDLAKLIAVGQHLGIRGMFGHRPRRVRVPLPTPFEKPQRLFEERPDRTGTKQERLGLGEIQELPGDELQPMRLAQQEIQQLTIRAGEGEILPENFHRAADGGEGIPHLVGNVRRELAQGRQPVPPAGAVPRRAFAR
jgi:hypothetical protein